MTLKVDYYPDDDILRISTGQKAMDGATLWDAVNVEVDIGTDGGHDIVGFSILSASASVCPYFALTLPWRTQDGCTRQGRAILLPVMIRRLTPSHWESRPATRHTGRQTAAAS